MSIDWKATLEDQAEFVKQIANDVAITLELPDLNDVQVSRLHRVVEQGASTFDRIMDKMDQHDLEVEILEFAETIADIGTNLSVSTANKLRDMRGLAPIGFPDGGQH